MFLFLLTVCRLVLTFRYMLYILMHTLYYIFYIIHLYIFLIPPVSWTFCFMSVVSYFNICTEAKGSHSFPDWPTQSWLWFYLRSSISPLSDPPDSDPLWPICSSRSGRGVTVWDWFQSSISASGMAAGSRKKEAEEGKQEALRFIFQKVVRARK